MRETGSASGSHSKSQPGRQYGLIPRNPANFVPPWKKQSWEIALLSTPMRLCPRTREGERGHIVDGSKIYGRVDFMGTISEKSTLGPIMFLAATFLRRASVLECT